MAIRSIYEVTSLLYRCEQEGFVVEKERLSLYGDAEVLVKRIQKFRVSLVR